MWPVILRVLRTYAPAITLPFAALVGIIGYNLENILSDKYTPYNDAIKDKREERLISDEVLARAANLDHLKYSRTTSVLNTNVSPSLQK